MKKKEDWKREKRKKKREKRKREKEKEGEGERKREKEKEEGEGGLNHRDGRTTVVTTACVSSKVDLMTGLILLCPGGYIILCDLSRRLAPAGGARERHGRRGGQA